MYGFAIGIGEWFEENRKTVGKDLAKYFGGNPNEEFTGRWFEKFAAMGDPNCFGPSDVLAIEALSVELPTESAAKLLILEADQFNGWLEQVPADKDLWEVDRSVVGLGSAADHLHKALVDLDGVGWVTAGKLVAAKRPRLIPILDKEVKKILQPPKQEFWVTMHDQLSDEKRRSLIAEVCNNAPDNVSLLRRIDVALWMHVKTRRA